MLYYLFNITKISKDIDPLKWGKDSEYVMTDKQTIFFFQSIYQLIATLFFAGAAITLLICFIKFMSPTSGQSRKEVQHALLFKMFLISAFFMIPGLLTLLLEAVLSLR